jgi:hypothetical protein
MISARGYSSLTRSATRVMASRKSRMAPLRVQGSKSTKSARAVSTPRLASTLLFNAVATMSAMVAAGVETIRRYPWSGIFSL